jgi:hypothetical protein
VLGTVLVQIHITRGVIFSRLGRLPRKRRVLSCRCLSFEIMQHVQPSNESQRSSQQRRLKLETVPFLISTVGLIRNQVKMKSATCLIGCLKITALA